MTQPKTVTTKVGTRTEIDIEIIRTALHQGNSMIRHMNFPNAIEALKRLEKVINDH